MKQAWILFSIAMLFSLSAHAVGAVPPPTEMMAAEVAHESMRRGNSEFGMVKGRSFLNSKFSNASGRGEL